jgi:hypothetical protein
MVRGVVRIVSLFLHSADVRCSGGWPHQSGRRVLRAIDFLCAREDMLRYAVCREPSVCDILADDDVAKAGTALLSLADDAHILLAVYKCPLRLGEVVDAACEDDSQGVHQSVQRRGKFQRWNICCGLREKDGVARERGLLNGGIPSTPEAHLLHAHTAE